MAKDVFRRGGRGVFSCGVCKRKCRETRNQSMGSDLCTWCWDLAGIENEINDGHCKQSERQADIDMLMGKITSKRGDISHWEEVFVDTSGGDGSGATYALGPHGPNTNYNDGKRPPMKTITVKELRELLEDREDGELVIFTADYGDHSHTEQALPIKGEIEEVVIERSAYSNSGFAIDSDEEDDEDVKYLVIK